MRVRNHCLLLSHEVMTILMLMALGSNQPVVLHLILQLQHLPISLLIACNNDHSDDFPEVMMYCRTKSLQNKEIGLARVWADDSRLGRSR